MQKELSENLLSVGKITSDGLLIKSSFHMSDKDKTEREREILQSPILTLRKCQKRVELSNQKVSNHAPCRDLHHNVKMSRPHTSVSLTFVKLRKDSCGDNPDVKDT